MKYVVIRDDDTNALTPIDYLERLYRPFLDRDLPVNLATIPNVNTEACYAPGKPELFLVAKRGPTAATLPIGSNRELVEYLQRNPGFKIVQHGCRHEFVHDTQEFNHDDRSIIASRLDEGTRYLMEAGFSRPTTFVAPYDQLSRTSLEEVSKRFQVLSSGWYELNKLPVTWWPKYALKKAMRTAHWRVGQTLLLTHPGCHLSYHKSYETMLDAIKRSIDQEQLTVLVTHWWEYFRDQKADEAFIRVLHDTAAYLANRADVRVVSFDDLARSRIALT